MLSKRIVFTRPKELLLEEIDIPSPSKDQILVKTLTTLISTGTELTIFSGEFPKGSHWDRYGQFPFVPGYSNCGKVVEVGEGVEEFRVGDRVVSNAPHMEYVLISKDEAIKVPSGVSDEEATFHNLAATVMNGVRLAKIQLGECVVIVGAGILGQLACQFSKLCGGFPVVVVDLSEFRLKLAKEFGADAVLHPRKDDVKKMITSLSKNRGADVVFEVTGNPNVVPWALSLVKRQGRYIQLSSPRGPSTVDFHDEVNFASRIIIGAHALSHPQFETPYNPWTRKRNVELFFDLLCAGRVNVKKMITNKYRYTEAKRVYQMLLEPTGERLKTLGVILDFR